MFAIIALDLEYETFVIYIAILSVDLGDKMHPSKRAQIIYLKVDKVSNKVSSKYANFANIFLLKSVIKLSKYTDINNYVIELIVINNFFIAPFIA